MEPRRPFPPRHAPIVLILVVAVLAGSAIRSGAAGAAEAAAGAPAPAKETGPRDVYSLDGPAFRVVVESGFAGFRVELRRGEAAWSFEPLRVRLRGRDGAPGEWKVLEPVRVKSLRLPSGEAVLEVAAPQASFLLALQRGGKSLRVTCKPADEEAVEEYQLLPEIRIPASPTSAVIVPAREGLLIPADASVMGFDGGGPAFQRTFGTSEYEGCHMNLLGILAGAKDAPATELPWAGIVSWEDAYVSLHVARTVEGESRQLVASATGRKTGRSILITPIGRGGIQEIAAAYREIAFEKGLRITLKDKLKGRPALERLIGASNFKLWTCLERSMSEDSRTEESVKVEWTFDQAARIAEHLKKEVGIDRLYFCIGGWIHRGYDCQHPDVLPAAPECGGNERLASALSRIRDLGYADSLHDNYQDIYRDSPSWSEALVQKRPDGSLAAGGKWLGGRAYLVCAPRQLDLARRPMNLPEVKRLFAPLTYFIDTTYAVGPQECFDAAHPLSRNDDIRWKSALSDYAREVFGVFGSECGREWAIPHSDYFEGLVGVGGKYYHQLDPAALGAAVFPFFEMVYHDCEIAWGKYGFDPEGADEYVLHHVACARPLHHHSVPSGLYWERPEESPAGGGTFTRADGGWAEGMCRTDRFLKVTHEVLGPLHRETAHLLLEHVDFFPPDATVRRMVWGRDQVIVRCNFGEKGTVARSLLGGDVALPRWGFLAESPQFLAFHATSFDGVTYEKGALFTIQSLDGKPLLESSRVRVFHGFGPATLSFRGRRVEVPKETVLEL